MITGTIVSVRAGRVRELSRPAWDHHEERTWHSAYGKDEIEGPVQVGALGLEGDQQADKEAHGGTEMAVLAYAAAHYRHWRAIPGLEAMGPGGFAENLTVESFDESGVCIGDVFEAGGVTLQVSSPRGPCASISRWWNEPRMVKLATESVRIGWYHRVRSAGTLERGDSYQLVDRPRPLLSVARVFRLRSGLEHDAATMRTLIECPELSPEWRRHLEALATRG